MRRAIAARGRAAASKERPRTYFSGGIGHSFSAGTWSEAQREIEARLKALIDETFPSAIGPGKFDFVVQHPRRRPWPFWKECVDHSYCAHRCHMIHVKVRVIVLLQKLNAQTSCEFTVTYGSQTAKPKRAGR